MINILFLDIDGVLNSERSCIAFNAYPWDLSKESLKQFDWVAIGLIRRICKETNTKIVLSSTWRLSINYKDIAKAFDLPIIDKTPHRFSSNRGEEIALWLRDHKPTKYNYVIVDDASDIIDYQLPRFVKVNPITGLSLNDYYKIKLIIGVNK
ncbi:MAG TPA: HAD domain-containing protein [Thermodesulfobacteriota bacterium]|nr:HAD domain-containing protein [Thermodesulfobacteriota bacterium]